LNILLTFIEYFPDIYLGGSYSLTAFGLLNRSIGDLDFHLPLSKKKEIKKILKLWFLNIKKHKQFGNEHIKAKFNNTAICIFFSDKNDKVYKIFDDNINMFVYVLDPEKVLEIKKVYVDDDINLSPYYDYTKHKHDIKEIEKNINEYRFKKILNKL
jgi:hypothetical protein